jgi:hypothetical protein
LPQGLNGDKWRARVLFIEGMALATNFLNSPQMGEAWNNRRVQVADYGGLRRWSGGLIPFLPINFDENIVDKLN